MVGDGGTGGKEALRTHRALPSTYASVEERRQVHGVRAATLLMTCTSNQSRPLPCPPTGNSPPQPACLLSQGYLDGGASGPSGPAAPSPEGAMQRLPLAAGVAAGPEGTGAAGPGGPGAPGSAAAGGSRGLGPALLAVLDYLKVLQGQPFTAQQVRFTWE